MRQEQHLTQGQQQKVAITATMQVSFRALQLPLPELEEWLKEEIEQNPVIEWDAQREEDGEPSTSFEGREINFEESSFEVLQDLDEEFEKSLFFQEQPEKRELYRIYHPTLHEHLMQQAREAFKTPHELALAEELIGNLDERGLLTMPIAKEAENIAAVIRTFDPPGIASRNFQECLLIQLRSKGKEHSMAYELIADHFDDLLHNRLPLLQKKMRSSVSEIKRVIDRELSTLNFHPAFHSEQEVVPRLVPDAIIYWGEESWQIEICEETLPTFRISSQAWETLENKDLSENERTAVRQYIASARGLQRAVQQRQKTLRQVIHVLIQRQETYLKGISNTLHPLVLKEIAQELSLHESTVARAVGDKYLLTPRGLISMKSLFSSSLSDPSTSTQEARELLLQLIRKENPAAPLSDQALALKIQEAGITCSRRTIAKYRNSLKIPVATQRRKWED